MAGPAVSFSKATVVLDEVRVESVGVGVKQAARWQERTKIAGHQCQLLPAANKCLQETVECTA